MIDPIDAALLAEHEKPQSKPYRTSGYTVREFAALPIARRLAIDAECSHRAGLVFTTHPHKAGQPYTVGRVPARNRFPQRAR
ncbi:hypothetical protein [Hymenobacter negativus]|uniref:Uncharacterized protein n=1 Tax=Hymenobacter negativus TaxID=2795026 RepID=A0ABS3QD75_9BACT|nr:hypothetical protein [Hymenobacter negativus]MBO2009197.1 hypothetical protein [Hymenobacter negativus]